MDLIRLILLKIEDEYKTDDIIEMKIDDYDRDTIIYHCQLLSEAGMISHCKTEHADGGVYLFWVGPLTWEGHDFLDSIRDNSRWNKVKETVKEHALPFAVDVIKDVAKAFVMSTVEGATRAVINVK